ncbi:hypothetical protein BBJ28_00002436 [Nothophytophthora sp. Chile5]|nr:hypothetical protein BBJ28_00002436 [Nothophytophthora sp. Chile5]
MADELTTELQRLESNHSELLLHQTTLKKQLAMRSAQLKQLQAAVTECAALSRVANAQDAVGGASSSSTAHEDREDVAMEEQS